MDRARFHHIVTNSNKSELIEIARILANFADANIQDFILRDSTGEPIPVDEQDLDADTIKVAKLLGYK